MDSGNSPEIIQSLTYRLLVRSRRPFPGPLECVPLAKPTTWPVVRTIDQSGILVTGTEHMSTQKQKLEAAKQAASRVALSVKARCGMMESRKQTIHRPAYYCLTGIWIPCQTWLRLDTIWPHFIASYQIGSSDKFCPLQFIRIPSKSNSDWVSSYLLTVVFRI